jgi:hypothetical protein
MQRRFGIKNMKNKPRLLSACGRDLYVHMAFGLMKLDSTVKKDLTVGFRDGSWHVTF